MDPGSESGVLKLNTAHCNGCNCSSKSITQIISQSSDHSFTFLLKKGVDKARLIYMNILRTLLARSAGGSQLLWGLKLAGKK